MERKMEDKELELPSVKCSKDLEKKRKRNLENTVDNESLLESPTDSSPERSCLESLPPAIGWPPMRRSPEEQKDVAIDSSSERSRLESLPTVNEATPVKIPLEREECVAIDSSSEKSRLEPLTPNLFENTVNKSLAESETESPVNELTPVKTPLEREEDVAIDSSSESEISRLESLPPKLLNRIICGVDFEDLKNLLLVSKRISEATIRAKEYFISPKKQFRVFPDAIGEEFTELRSDEDEIAPNAPMRENRGKRISKEQLSGICKDLFQDFVDSL